MAKSVSSSKLSKKKVSSGSRSSSNSGSKNNLPKSAPQPFRSPIIKEGDKKVISRTKTSTNVKRADNNTKVSPSINMDSYIEDLLSDENAIDVLVGSLTDSSNRVIRYHIKEFPGSYCSITITAPYSKQKWAIYVPIAEELKDILGIWQRLPHLERRDLLGAWILRSSNLEFDPKGHISGINFEHKSFRTTCKKHFFLLMNSAITPALQAAVRGFLARKRFRHMRLQRKREAKLLEKLRQRESPKMNSPIHLDMRIGSSLETSTTLDEDSSFLSRHVEDKNEDGDEEVEEEEALQQEIHRRERDNTPAEEVEDNLTEHFKKLIETKKERRESVEEVQEDFVPSKGRADEARETGNSITERKREIDYLSKKLLKKKKKTRSASTGSASSTDGEKFLKKEKKKKEKMKEKNRIENDSDDDSFVHSRNLSVRESPAMRKARKSITPSHSPLASPSSRQMSKTISPMRSLSPTRGRKSRSASCSPSTENGKHSLSIEHMIIEHEPNSKIGGELSSLASKRGHQDPETEDISYEINQLRDFVQSQMASFISEVGALTVSMQKNNSPTKLNGEDSLHETPVPSVVLSPPQKENIEEESKLEEIEGMKSEIQELRSLVDSLRQGVTSVEPPCQKQQEQQQNKEDKNIGETNVSDTSTISAINSKDTTDTTKDFTRISISGGGEQDDFLEMSGVFPPFSSPLLSHTSRSHHSPQMLLRKQSTEEDCSSLPPSQLELIVEEPAGIGSPSSNPPYNLGELQAQSVESSTKIGTPDKHFDDKKLFSSTAGTEISTPGAESDSNSYSKKKKKKKKDKKKKDRSTSPEPVVSDTTNFLSALITQQSASELTNGMITDTLHNKDNDDFNALEQADDLLRRELDIYQEQSSKKDIARKKIQKKALSTITTFLVQMIQRNKRLRSLRSSLEMHENSLTVAAGGVGSEMMDKNRTARVRNLRLLCDDLEKSMECGSIQLGGLTIIDICEYFSANRRVQSIVAVQKHCPSFPQVYIRFMYSFLSTNSIMQDSFVLLEHFVKKRLFVVELLESGIVEFLMTAALRCKNHKDFICTIFDVVEFLLSDLPDGYTVAVMMSTKSLKLLKRIASQVGGEDKNNDISHRIFAFINTLCRDNSSMITSYENIGLFEALADACFDLVENTQILTFALCTCALGVEHNPEIVKNFNNQGHAEIIVECLLNYTLDNTKDSLKHFNIVVGLFLTLCATCPTFVRYFPSHHFLSSIMTPLQFREDNLFSLALLTLAKSLLLQYPVLKSKFIQVEFSDIVVPFITDQEEGPEVKEAARSLQLMIYPDWNPNTPVFSSRLPSRDTSRRSRGSSRGASAFSRTGSRTGSRPLVSRPGSSKVVKASRQTSPPDTDTNDTRQKLPLPLSHGRSSPLETIAPTNTSFQHIHKSNSATQQKQKDLPPLASIASASTFDSSQLLPTWKDDNETQLFSVSPLNSAGARSNSAGVGFTSIDVGMPSAELNARLNSATSRFEAECVGLNLPVDRFGSAGSGIGSASHRIGSAGDRLGSADLRLGSAGSRRMQFSGTPPVVSLLNQSSNSDNLPSARVPMSPMSPRPSSNRPASRSVTRMSKKRALMMITPVVFRHVSRKRIAKAKQNRKDAAAEAKRALVQEKNQKKKRAIEQAKMKAKILLQAEDGVALRSEEQAMERERGKVRTREKEVTVKSDRSKKEAEDLDEDSSMKTIVLQEKASLQKEDEEKKLKKKKRKKEKGEKKKEGEGVLELTGDDMGAEACMLDLASAIHSRNGDYFLAMLNTMLKLVNSEVGDPNSDGAATDLFFSKTGLLVEGGQVFAKDNNIVVAILDTLWLFKSKLKKKINMKVDNVFEILKSILKAHVTNVEVCKKVIRLYDRKSLQLVDDDFIALVVAVFKQHMSDETIQNGLMNILNICLSQKNTFQTSLNAAGGCNLILDLYAMQAKGIAMGDLVNIILVLASDHPGNKAIFGSMKAMTIYLDALIHNIHSENAFNLATVPIFYALKSFTDPNTFKLDECFLDPISNLFAFIKQQEDSVIAERTLEWILKFVRELCTIPSSKELFMRSHFTSTVMEYLAPPHPKHIRKLTKSIVKKMTRPVIRSPDPTPTSTPALVSTMARSGNVGTMHTTMSSEGSSPVS